MPDIQQLSPPQICISLSLHTVHHVALTPKPFCTFLLTHGSHPHTCFSVAARGETARDVSSNPSNQYLNLQALQKSLDSIALESTLESIPLARRIEIRLESP
mmetsp:Transcript_42291/g.68963  ORF Transcript_42291/g.68963 Transcript_42291/m.68963 type:complete len:102 (-) Transcript_42291:15-320(-)